ncbi:18454_t:CDS:10 [Rhizophagus irregularis]|nr:18454_t:CDS:10 [Rhizophagus irregularis]
MSGQLELMFDLLQQEVDKLTADLAREDSDDLLHSNDVNPDTISENDSPLELDANLYSLYNLKSEIERSLKKEDSSNPIISDPVLSIPPTISFNTHQRSASHKEMRNLDSTSLHQKSKSVDSRNVKSKPRDNNLLHPRDSQTLDIKNSAVDDQKTTISNENSSPTLSPTSSLDLSTGKKKIKRTPTTGRGLGKSQIKSVNETFIKSYDTDDENRPLSSRSNSKAQDINFDKQSVILRLNLRTQESKYGSETSSSTLYETDDENRPLRSRSNSKAQDTNLDKQGEDNSLNSTNSPVRTQRNRNSIDQTHRSSGSKEKSSDDHIETSKPPNSKEHTEGPRSQERNSNDNKIFSINSSKLKETEHVHDRSESIEKESDDREVLGNKYRGENGEGGRRIHSQDHDVDSQINVTSTRAISRIREPEDKEQIRSKNKVEKSSEKENVNRENLEERGRESKEERGRAKSKVRGEEERGRAKSRVREEEERERAKSRVHEEEERGRAKSKVRGEEERGRAKSKVRGEEERGRAKSRVREEEERGRAKSKVRGEEERGRAKSRVREEEERGRAKSRVREEEERGRAKSRVREEEERGRAKSKVREEEERGRTKSKVQEERERVKSKPLEERGRTPKEREVVKSKTQENENRERAKSRTRYRREKAEVHVEKEEAKITEVKLTTQIFIENLRQYRTLSITATRTALDILNYFRDNETISDSESWTLFEVINEYGLERPIRDWEYVATVIGNWEPNKQNALVLKKYINRNCLTLGGFKNAVPPMFGSLHLEVKKNKWQKRHFFIRDGTVYHCKDAKGNNETLLCSLASFDVYTFTKTVRKSPTKFIFALKSQDKVAMFENPDDYIRYLCADHLDKMKDWVLSLRAAKNNLLRAKYPERFEKTIKSDDKLYSEKSGENSTELNESNNKVSERRRSINQWENLRKHVRNSTLYGKIENNSLRLITNPGLKKKESDNGIKDSLNNTSASSGDQKFKEGSLLDYNEKIPSPKQVEPESKAFVKGSLLASNDALFEQAKEREKLRKAIGGVGIIRDQNSRLVQIENGVQFNKGSLLTKSKTQRSHKNPSGTLLKIDAPLSKSAPVQSILSPNGKTLLEIDLKPDAAHTIALRNTNVKPLLSFVPGENNYNNIGVKSPRSLGFNHNNNEESETSSEYDSDDKLY